MRSAFACRTWSSSSTGDKGTDDTSSRDTSTGDRALVQQRHESAVEAAANPLDAIVASLKDDDDGALAVRSRRDKSGSSSSSSTTTGRQQQRHGDAGITYRPLTAPKFEPVAVPSTVAELAQQRQLLVNRVRQHQRDVQAAVQKSLDHIVSQNRIVNAWVRANKQSNGSMV